MNKICIFSVAAVLILFCGCKQTRVAQVRASDEELVWEEMIRDSYPGHKPPRYAAPAVSGHTQDRASAIVRRNNIPKPLNTPDTAEAPAPAPAPEPAETPEPAVEAEKTDAAAVEVKADDKAEVKTEDKKTDAAAVEVKADDKAEVKAEDKKADDKKVHVKIEPPDPTGCIVYEVKIGDTLGKLAQRYYGSARHANLIQRANADIIKNQNVLKPGMRLIIPKL